MRYRTGETVITPDGPATVVGPDEEQSAIVVRLPAGDLRSHRDVRAAAPADIREQPRFGHDDLVATPALGMARIRRRQTTHHPPSVMYLAALRNGRELWFRQDELRAAEAAEIEALGPFFPSGETAADRPQTVAGPVDSAAWTGRDTRSPEDLEHLAGILRRAGYGVRRPHPAPPDQGSGGRPQGSA